MVKHNQIIRLLPINFLSVFDPFVGLPFKGLIFQVLANPVSQNYFRYYRDHSFSTCAKFSETQFLTPDTQPYLPISGGKKFLIFGKFYKRTIRMNPYLNIFYLVSFEIMTVFH